MSELASLSDSSHQSALQHFQLLRVHLEDDRSLAAIASEAKISYFTLQNWLERYRASGLSALARKSRIDCGRRRKLAQQGQKPMATLSWSYRSWTNLPYDQPL
jgi:transposase